MRERSLIKLLLSFALFVTVSVQLMAGDLKTILLNDKDGKDDYVLEARYLEVLEDPTGSLTIEDILQPEYDKKFKLHTSKNPASNANLKSNYWVKFKAKNISSYGVRYIFESYSPHTEVLNLYYKDKSGKIISRESGTTKGFYQREYVNKNLVLDLPLPQHEETVFYVKVYEKSYYSSFDFRFKTFNYWSFYSTNEYYILGIYYGILIIMLLYNLLLFFNLKEKVYIYFVLYIFSGILNSASDDGLGYQYLWPNAHHLQPIIGTYIAPILLMFAFVMYARKFLQLDENFPKQSKLIMNVFVGYVIYHFVSLFIKDPGYLRLLNIVPYAVVFYTAIICFKKNYLPAKFFMIGSGLIMISVTIIQLRPLGLVSGNLFTVYSLNYALMIDVLVFSLALIERIKYIKQREEEAQLKVIEQLKENEKLKDKVNRELETKVNERTQELNEANEELLITNEKLKEMTEKANEMSAKLDLDNWQLQKSNKEAIRARIVDQEVSFKEFLRIFPNDMACYKYLAELKWDKDFKCRKCSHNKYMDGNKPYSRKCTRCAYPESVTAYTLFHGLRFSIVKAFYLTYLTQKGDSKKTLRELSELLELRRNTCWNFKKKVQEVLDKYETKKKKPAESWEDIIFTE